jgi:hypothetical protein
MYERKRRAIDLAGQRVEIIQRQESRSIVTLDGRKKYLGPAKFFGPDGRQLIPEGRGFFRTPFGIRFKLVDE